jgi:hypothetical protein
VLRLHPSPHARYSQSSTLTFNHFCFGFFLSSIVDFLAQHTGKSLNFGAFFLPSPFLRQWEIIFVNRLAVRRLPANKFNYLFLGSRFLLSFVVEIAASFFFFHRKFFIRTVKLGSNDTKKRKKRNQKVAANG